LVEIRQKYGENKRVLVSFETHTIIWNSVSVLGVKNQTDGATGPRKNFGDIFSHMDTIHQCDGQTDGRTDTGRQQRPHLRIVSRG